MQNVLRQQFSKKEAYKRPLGHDAVVNSNITLPEKKFLKKKEGCLGGSIG